MQLAGLESEEGPNHGCDTVRVWLSDQQWMKVLEKVARDAEDFRGDERRRSTEPRHDTRMKCLLRLGYPGQKPGTYVVRSRNLSSGGMGFVHNAYVEAGTHCAVALQHADGYGVVASGRIAWCRRIDLDVFDVGISFDEPIEIDAYIPTDPQDGNGYAPVA